MYNSNLWDEMAKQYTKDFTLKIVKDVAQFLSDRVNSAYAGLLIEMCKLYCNQKLDTHYEIGSGIAKLAHLRFIEENFIKE